MLLFVGFSHYTYYIYYAIAAKVTKTGVTSRMSFKSSHVILMEKLFPQNTRVLIIMLNYLTLFFHYFLLSTFVGYKVLPSVRIYRGEEAKLT